MDILIKSFNRAYYLDRCLCSIACYVKNFTGNIYVLDDGTPSVYLDKILLKHPTVKILKSHNYSEKSKLIEVQNYNLPHKIPSKFWYESVRDVSDYFILLEDDIWFTSPIDIASLKNDCENENVAQIKLFWLSNPMLIGNKITKTLDSIALYKPNLQFKRPLLFKYIYTKHHALWRKGLTILGLYSIEKLLGYYTIYSVAGAIFKKDYFLSIWNDASAVLNEYDQLLNAISYADKNQNVIFGRTNSEVLKTGFMSSAFPKYQFSEFFIHDFNATLNDYWLIEDELFCSNFESDIDEHGIKSILALKNKPETYILEWQEWVRKFKGDFKKIGCNI